MISDHLNTSGHQHYNCLYNLDVVIDSDLSNYTSRSYAGISTDSPNEALTKLEYCWAIRTISTPKMS